MRQVIWRIAKRGNSPPFATKAFVSSISQALAEELKNDQVTVTAL